MQKHESAEEIISKFLQTVQSAQQPAPSAPQGAITGQGIRNWQKVIIFVVTGFVALGGGLVSTSISGANTMTNMQRDIVDLKKQVDMFAQVKQDQSKTAGDVKELQLVIVTLTERQKEILSRLDMIGESLRFTSQQVTMLTQTKKGGR